MTTEMDWDENAERAFYEEELLEMPCTPFFESFPESNATVHFMPHNSYPSWYADVFANLPIALGWVHLLVDVYGTGNLVVRWRGDAGDVGEIRTVIEQDSIWALRNYVRRAGLVSV